jgi:23S rRNA (uridine2552-2'-O)-methyltransferase
VFKLADLLGRVPRVRRGAVVVELGCWPGGWLQVLAERVGPEGVVLGVDRVAIDPLAAPVRFVELDFAEPDAAERIAQELGRPADVVLSDAAPKLSGIRDVDRAGEEELYDAALRVAERVLAPDGTLVVKGFPSPEAERFRRTLRERFAVVSEARPEGRRSTSKEFYWIALRSPAGHRGARKPGRKATPAPG